MDGGRARGRRGDRREGAGTPYDPRGESTAVIEHGNPRVYVNNLSWRTAWQDLKDHFRKVGEVVHADVMKNSEGRSMGCGIVEFRTPEEARRAILELHDTELEGRLIGVREDREAREAGGTARRSRGPPPRAPRGSPVPRSSGGAAGGTRVYFGGLPWAWRWQELKDLASTVGRVRRADVFVDDGGKSKGYGIVEFEDAIDAGRAIAELNNSVHDGLTLNVREDREAGGPPPPVVPGGRAVGGGGRGGGGLRVAGGAAGGRGHPGEVRIIIEGMPEGITWRDIKDEFSSQDFAVTHVEPIAAGSGRADVALASMEEAKRAITHYNGTSFNDKKVRVYLK